MITLPEDITLFCYIYFFCFLGAYSKDLVDTFLDKITEVLILKVLISSLGVTILLYGISEYLLERISYRFFTAICYTFGVTSFKVVVKYNNVQEFLLLINEFRKWRTGKK
ncbi:MAG: hypothetical protein JJT76_20065 [Clostridiaceae bacterium]|nr:hypothetical protein [Clostridiaceae bacterium]